MWEDKIMTMDQQTAELLVRLQQEGFETNPLLCLINNMQDHLDSLRQIVSEGCPTEKVRDWYCGEESAAQAIRDDWECLECALGDLIP